MSTFWKYANIKIPAGVELYRHWDLWEPCTKLAMPLSVRAKIPCRKDGRPRAISDCWLFSYCNRPYLLAQGNESKVTLTNIEIKKVA
jgi:hypothetical protein